MSATLRTASVAVAIVVALAGVPGAVAAKGDDEPVIATKRGESQVAASDGYLAWDANTRAQPSHFDVFARRRGGGDRFKVNARGTEGVLGGIDEGVLVYQQYRGSIGAGRSDLKLFDLGKRTRRSVPGVNTNAWEYLPSKSGARVLFGRVDGDGNRVLLANLRKDRIRTLASGGSRARFQPGQVNGNFATWLEWPAGSRSRVHRLNIRTGNVRRVPNRKSFDWAPSVTDDGTVYFGRTGRRCGSNARLMRWVPGRGTHEVVDFPRRIDISDSYVHETDAGKLQVFHNRLRCRNLATGGDIWRVVDPWTSTLRVTKDGNGSGRVTSRPGGIRCGADCAQDYEPVPGAAVVLRANPAEDSRFEGWSGVSCADDDTTCRVPIGKSDRTVTATFMPGGGP
ncbi:MAG TPA: hypothetical protein VHJ34_13805 [Actinomycetota bacterium]|nr:hypothetical protein [Actinomycetota bacterium]